MKPTKPAGCFLQAVGAIGLISGIGLLAATSGNAGIGIVLLAAGLGLMAWGRLGLKKSAA